MQEKVSQLATEAAIYTASLDFKKESDRGTVVFEESLLNAVEEPARLEISGYMWLLAGKPRSLSIAISNEEFYTISSAAMERIREYTT